MGIEIEGAGQGKGRTHAPVMIGSYGGITPQTANSEPAYLMATVCRVELLPKTFRM